MVRPAAAARAPARRGCGVPPDFGRRRRGVREVHAGGGQGARAWLGLVHARCRRSRSDGAGPRADERAGDEGRRALRGDWRAGRRGGARRLAGRRDRSARSTTWRSTTWCWSSTTSTSWGRTPAPGRCSKGSCATRRRAFTSCSAPATTRRSSSRGFAAVGRSSISGRPTSPSGLTRSAPSSPPASTPTSTSSRASCTCSPAAGRRRSTSPPTSSRRPPPMPGSTSSSRSPPAGARSSPTSRTRSSGASRRRCRTSWRRSRSSGSAPPELLEALGRAGAAETLEALARRGLVVAPPPGSTGGYSLHALVREFTQTSWGASPARSRDLRRRAAEWYESQDRIAEALEAAIAAADGEHVARLLKAPRLRAESPRSDRPRRQGRRRRSAGAPPDDGERRRVARSDPARRPGSCRGVAVALPRELGGARHRRRDRDPALPDPHQPWRLAGGAGGARGRRGRPRTVHRGVPRLPADHAGPRGRGGETCREGARGGAGRHIVDALRRGVDGDRRDRADARRIMPLPRSTFETPRTWPSRSATCWPFAAPVGGSRTALAERGHLEAALAEISARWIWPTEAASSSSSARRGLPAASFTSRSVASTRPRPTSCPQSRYTSVSRRPGWPSRSPGSGTCTGSVGRPHRPGARTSAPSP